MSENNNNPFDDNVQRSNEPDLQLSMLGEKKEDNITDTPEEIDNETEDSDFFYDLWDQVLADEEEKAEKEQEKKELRDKRRKRHKAEQKRKNRNKKQEPSIMNKTQLSENDYVEYDKSERNSEIPKQQYNSSHEEHIVEPSVKSNQKISGSGALETGAVALSSPTNSHGQESNFKNNSLNSDEPDRTIAQSRRDDFYKREFEAAEEQHQQDIRDFKQGLIDEHNRKQEIYKNKESIGSHGIDFSEKQFDENYDIPASHEESNYREERQEDLSHSTGEQQGSRYTRPEPRQYKENPTPSKDFKHFPTNENNTSETHYEPKHNSQTAKFDAEKHTHQERHQENKPSDEYIKQTESYRKTRISEEYHTPYKEHGINEPNKRTIQEPSDSINSQGRSNVIKSNVSPKRYTRNQGENKSNISSQKSVPFNPAANNSSYTPHTTTQTNVNQRRPTSSYNEKQQINEKTSSPKNRKQRNTENTQYTEKRIYNEKSTTRSNSLSNASTKPSNNKQGYSTFSNEKQRDKKLENKNASTLSSVHTSSRRAEIYKNQTVNGYTGRTGNKTAPTRTTSFNKNSDNKQSFSSQSRQQGKQYINPNNRKTSDKYKQNFVENKSSIKTSVSGTTGRSTKIIGLNKSNTYTNSYIRRGAQFLGGTVASVGEVATRTATKVQNKVFVNQTVKAARQLDKDSILVNGKPLKNAYMKKTDMYYQGNNSIREFRGNRILNTDKNRPLNLRKQQFNQRPYNRKTLSRNAVDRKEFRRQVKEIHQERLNKKFSNEITVNNRHINKLSEKTIIQKHADRMGIALRRSGRTLFSTVKNQFVGEISSGDYKGAYYARQTKNVFREVKDGIVIISGAPLLVYSIYARTRRSAQHLRNAGRHFKGVKKLEITKFKPTNLKQVNKRLYEFGKKDVLFKRLNILNNRKVIPILNRRIRALESIGINNLSAKQLAEYKNLLKYRSTRRIGKRIQKRKGAKGNISQSLLYRATGLLSQGDAGLQGIAKGIQIVSNRYVRGVVKNAAKLTKTTGKITFKGIKFAGKGAYKVIVPKATRAKINTTVYKGKKAVTKKILHSKPVQKVRRGINGGIYNFAKRGVSNITPKPIKTAAKRVIGANKKATSTVKTAKKGIKKIKKKVTSKVKSSMAGKAYRTVKKAVDTMKTAFGAFFKKLLLYAGGVLAVLLIIAMIINVFAACMSAFAGGKENLQGYIDHINNKQSSFNQTITNAGNQNAASGSGYKYDNVYTHYTAGSSTENTREILSMTVVYFHNDFPWAIDFIKRNKVHSYMDQLFDKSHSYTTSPSAQYYCSDDPNAETDYCTHRKQRSYYCNVKYKESDKPSQERRNLWYQYGQYGGCKTRTYYCTEHGHAIYNSQGCKTKYDGSTINYGSYSFTHSSKSQIWGCNNQTRHVLTTLTSSSLPHRNLTFMWNNGRWEIKIGNTTHWITGTSYTPSNIGSNQMLYKWNNSQNRWEYGEYWTCNGHLYCDGKHTERYCDGNHKEYYCPGNHQDLDIYITVKGFDDIFDVDDEGNKYSKGNTNDYGFEGWHEDDKSWARHVYEQEWSDVYEGLKGLPDILEHKTLSDYEVYQYINKYVNVNLPEKRKSIIKQSLLAVGRIPYYDGGKPTAKGMTANNFGKSTDEDSSGRTRKGLDMAGFVQWAYWTGTNNKLGNGSVSDIINNTKSITANQLKPGDIGLWKTDSSSNNYIGIYLGKDNNNNRLWIMADPSDENNTVVIKNSPLLKNFRTLK